MNVFLPSPYLLSVLRMPKSWFLHKGPLPSNSAVGHGAPVTSFAQLLPHSISRDLGHCSLIVVILWAVLCYAPAFPPLLWKPKETAPDSPKDWLQHALLWSSGLQRASVWH